MPVSKKLKTAGLVISFFGLVLLILFLIRWGFVSVQQAGLMVVALFGMYVGFGILIVAYRMVSKLD